MLLNFEVKKRTPGGSAGVLQEGVLEYSRRVCWSTPGGSAGVLQEGPLEYSRRPSWSPFFNLVFVEEEMMVVEAERNISLDLHPPGLADTMA